MAEAEILVGPAKEFASTPTKLRPLGHEGISIFGGKMEAQVPAGGTYEFAMEVDADAADLSRLRVAIGLSRAASTPVFANVFGALGVFGSLAELDTALAGSFTTSGIGGRWWNTTWWGSQGGTIQFPSTVRNRNICVSDVQDFSPVARTDGKTKALIAARLYIGASAGNLAMIRDDTASFANWPTRAEGLVRLRSHPTSGDQRLTISGWAASNITPNLGVIFGSHRPILNVLILGDSIAEGSGDQYPNGGFTRLAIDGFNAAGHSCGASLINQAWAGTASIFFVEQLKDAIRCGLRPDVVVFPVGTPNDMAGRDDPISATIVAGWRLMVMRILQICAQERIGVIGYSVLPVASSVRNWNLSDSQSDARRITHIAGMESQFRAAGNGFVNFEQAIAGTPDASGQVQPRAGMLWDGIHPGDGSTSGNRTMAPLLQAELEKHARGFL